MSEKYYTPTIEEFHHGFLFENEVGTSDGLEWEKQVYTIDGICDFEEYIKDGRVRVKYLDEQDILDEGWVRINETEFVIQTHSVFVLDLFENGKTGHIFRGETVRRIAEGEHSTVFYGIIRNRSELRQIMKMLGIK